VFVTYENIEFLLKRSSLIEKRLIYKEKSLVGFTHEASSNSFSIVSGDENLIELRHQRSRCRCRVLKLRICFYDDILR
jgi:hypothetical protein